MKVLLLSDCPPCTNYSGGLMLLQLARFLPPGSLSCFTVLLRPHVNPVIPADFADMPIAYAQKPRQRWNLYRGWLGTAVSALMEAAIAAFILPVIARRAARFGRANGVEAVWCVLAGQTMIRLARPVARRLGVPLYAQVWDPPYWWLRENQVDPLTTRLVLHEFDAVLHESRGRASASPGMAEAFTREHGVDSVPIISCMPASMARPPADRPHRDDELTIGMAGQLYARTEWDALLRTLDESRWMIAGRAVRLRLLGAHPGLQAAPGQRIEVAGWQSQEDTVRLLAETDVLYCPYWFDPAFRAEASQSFPSKLATYLAAGRPVLVHAPGYATPSLFVARHETGLCCDSLEPAQIRQALERLAGDAALYRRLSHNAHTAFLQHLTTDAMRTQFFEFLGFTPKAAHR